MGKADKACFSGSVISLSGVADEAHHGADIDDAARARLEHSAGGGADPAEGTRQVGIDDGAPVRIFHAHDEAVFRDARVVDQGTEGAGLFLNGGDDLFGGLRVGNIRSVDGGFSPRRFNRGADFMELRRLAGHES